MRDTKRGARTESLSLRIDPKTKFVLEFMVRQTGMRITELIERAIKDQAEKTRVGEISQFDEGKTWAHYWHPVEGVRVLKLILDPDVQTTFDEDELANFVKSHWQFFFIDRDCKEPAKHFIEVLWPRIDEYLAHWRDNKASDWWATGKLMKQAIGSAQMGTRFEWPPSAKPKQAPATILEIDDEIPF